MSINDLIIPITILLVVTITILVFLGIWRFGEFLFKQKFFSETRKDIHYIIDNLLHHSSKSPYSFQSILHSLGNLYDDHTEKRNEFWTTYGQIVISIFIVCIIALLLLTKVISAEAGLPILSAISGFAIAKTSTVRNNNNKDLPPRQ